MNIRPIAIKWYQKYYGVKPKYFHASKYFEPQESWSNTPVWWFQLLLRCLQDKFEPYITFAG